MLQAILVSIVAFLAAIDEYTFRGVHDGETVIYRAHCGADSGDFQAGIMIGATLELMFIGSIMVGSATPPEVYASSVLGNSHLPSKAGREWGTAVVTGSASVHIPADVEKRLLRHRRQLGRQTDREGPGPEKFKKGKHVASHHTAADGGRSIHAPGVLCHVFWRRQHQCGLSS